MQGWITTSTIKSFTINLAQTHASRYCCTASNGDIFIETCAIHVDVAGTGLTSVAISTNDTNAHTLLSAGEGAVASLVLGASLIPATQQQSFVLKNGKSIIYTIAGDGATGQLTFVVKYIPINGVLNATSGVVP